MLLAALMSEEDNESDEMKARDLIVDVMATGADFQLWLHKLCTLISVKCLEYLRWVPKR